MDTGLTFGRRLAQSIRSHISRARAWYSERSRLQKAGIVLGILVLVFLGVTSLRGGSEEPLAQEGKSVTLKTVGELSGTGTSLSILSEVRSVTEADILAQSGGTVRAVRTAVGRTVSAGAVIAELENASARAQVLSAQGAYESALAARSITKAQTGNTQLSLEEAATGARNTYRTAFTTIDSLFVVEIQSLFGGNAYTPGLLMSGGNSAAISEEYRTLRREVLPAWRINLERAGNTDPETLLNDAERIATRIQQFLITLARIAATTGSEATDAQKANIESARADIDAVLAQLSAARDAYRAKQTASSVAVRQSESRAGEVASADAQVKTALGNLRAAEAELEKTIVRAPIAGTVNFLPIRVGDYVTAFTHVATIARNNALEVVAYISEDDRTVFTTGARVLIEDTIPGVITSVAPALDPSTKQIEVHIAVTGTSKLVNGQSVRVTLPNTPKTSATESVLTLPLSSVKLRANERIIFTVNSDNRLEAQTIEVGEVRGDRITVLTPLSPELRIVRDARGLSSGQKVRIREE